MKKYIVILTVTISGSVFAQQNGDKNRVGINTDTPKATLDISKNIYISNTRPQGVIFPHMTTAERNLFVNVQEGTMIYNVDVACVQFYNGTEWICFDGKKL